MVQFGRKLNKSFNNFGKKLGLSNKHFGRKLYHTTNQINNVVQKAAPIAAFIAPEFSPHIALAAAGSQALNSGAKVGYSYEKHGNINRNHLVRFADDAQKVKTKYNQLERDN